MEHSISKRQIIYLFTCLFVGGFCHVGTMTENKIKIILKPPNAQLPSGSRAILMNPNCSVWYIILQLLQQKNKL